MNPRHRKRTSCCTNGRQEFIDLGL
jgi:hypothetical protein